MNTVGKQTNTEYPFSYKGFSSKKRPLEKKNFLKGANQKFLVTWDLWLKICRLHHFSIVISRKTEKYFDKFHKFVQVYSKQQCAITWMIWKAEKIFCHRVEIYYSPTIERRPLGGKRPWWTIGAQLLQVRPDWGEAWRDSNISQWAAVESGQPAVQTRHDLLHHRLIHRPPPQK